MDGLAPSTINVRLSAIRKLVIEARKITACSPPRRPATSLTSPTSGSGAPGWGTGLRKEQARELLAVPDRSTPKRQTRLRHPRPAGRLCPAA